MRTSSRAQKPSSGAQKQGYSVKSLMGRWPKLAALAVAGSLALPLVTDQIARTIVVTAPTKVPIFMLNAAAAAKKASSAADIAVAVKLISKGKAGKAEAVLNRAISSGKLKTTDMAKALHYRGIALRKQGKPAQAIADFTNAIYLKNGLSPALRKEAETQRAAAYQQAGAGNGLIRGKTGGKSAKTPRTVNARNTRRTATRSLRTAGSNWQTSTRASSPASATRKPRAQPKSSFGGGIGSFFSNIFSSGKKAAKPETATNRATARSTRRAGAGIQTRVSSWNSTTSVQPANRHKQRAAKTRAAPKRIASRQPIARQPTARQRARRARPTNSGTVARAQRAAVGARQVAGRQSVASSYRLILSPVRSADVAKTNANKVRRQFAGLLAQRQPVIESTTFGGGIFYQVRIGPFADARAPQSICSKLKADGVDCILTRQSSPVR